MGKKRKTRQEKIILQLKRKIAAQKTKEAFLESKPEIRQEANSYRYLSRVQENLSTKKQDNIAFSYGPKLVKRDIFKTLVLSLIIIGFQLVIYLKLR